MLFVLPIFAAKRFEHLPPKCDFFPAFIQYSLYTFYALYVYEAVGLVVIEKHKKKAKDQYRKI